MTKQELTTTPAAENIGELKVIPVNDWQGMIKAKDIAGAMSVNSFDDGPKKAGAAIKESDLIRIKIPSGGSTTNWTIPRITGDETIPAIEGILVRIVARSMLWPTEDPVEGSMPALVTSDFVTGRRIADAEDLPAELLRQLEPFGVGDMRHRADKTPYFDAYDWASLPQAQYGSGKNGRGKAVNDQRVCFILRKGDIMPVIVTIGTGSFGNFRKFLRGLTQAGLPYYRSVVSFTLAKTKNETGQPYCEVCPTLIGVLSEDDAAAVQKAWGSIVDAAVAGSFTG